VVCTGGNFLKIRYKIGLGFVVLIIAVSVYGNIPQIGNISNVVVSNYYSYFSMGEVQRAESLLTPAFRKILKSKNIVHSNTYFLKLLSVQGPFNIRLDNSYKQEVQVIANYFVISSLGSGFQTRFIYLGRDGSNDPWRIMSIETGP
jgi:hypothetical protein